MANSTDSQDISVHLGAISGAEHLCAGEDSLIISPAHTGQVSELLRYANTRGVSVRPSGAGTKQAWGNPSRSSLTMKTGRMARVLEHTWQDMTCSVEAGCPWSAMQTELARHGQFVALDPLWPDRATVGGIVATNDSGSLRLRYGSLRDLIIGMTIVLADGTVARSGGKVVKNVAGYDLHKLMTGAFGTLGIVTEVTFRLHSIARHVQSFRIHSKDVQALGQILLRLIDSPLSIRSMQLRAEEGESALDVQLATLPEVIVHQSSALATIAQASGLEVDDTDDEVWQARQGIFDRAESFVVKATMFPTEIARFAKAVGAMGGVSVTQAPGLMTASVPFAAADRLPPLREAISAAQGSLTVLGQVAGEPSLGAWAAQPNTLPLMRELKRRFDPNCILNPGRFHGGI